jgi:hypothetical protein
MRVALPRRSRSPVIKEVMLYKMLKPGRVQLSLSQLFGVEFSALFGVFYRHHGRAASTPGIGPEARTGSVSFAPTAFRVKSLADQLMNGGKLGCSPHPARQLLL